jgi:TonB family protein
MRGAPGLPILVCALALLVSSRARAQPAAPADSGEPKSPTPSVTPPIAISDEGAEYPKQAIAEGFHDEVDVALILTIDATGAVTRVEVQTPAGHGFDEAATAAAERLRFRPATRDGRAVAARQRFVYRFAPPAGALAGRAVRSSDDRPIGGATVIVREPSGAEITTTTGDDGAWRLPRVPAGEYHVTVQAPGMATREADERVTPGEETASVDRLVESLTAASMPSDAVQEVEVHGERPPREVTKRTLDRREIDRIPGTNGDALRSLQNLPGVARPPPLSGLLIVRGSAPQDTQYFVDGTPVPIVYHFGGLSSVVPTELLDRIDFYPGNFSAQYGRAMGGIVDVGLTDPKKDRFRAMASIDLIDMRALAQGPLWSSGWTFAVGGRRSTVDAWLPSVLSATRAGVSITPVYYDYQAIAARDLGHGSKIRFAFFGSDDKIDVFLPNASASTPDIAGAIGLHTGFWRGQALYSKKLSDAAELRIVGAAGRDYVSFGAGNLFFNLDDWSLSARVELAAKLSERSTMNVGFDAFYAPYTLSAQLPPPPKAGQPPPGPFSAQPPVTVNASDALAQPAFYAEWEATPWRGGRIVPGVRLDYTKDTKSWDLAPRLVVRQDIANDPRTTLKAGVGLFAQPPQPQETNAIFGTPGLTSNRAYHYDLGVEREFPPRVEVSLEGFYKQLDHLVAQGIGNTGSGVVYGAETLIRYKPDERFFGWLAYTLSRSLRRTQPGAPLRVFLYDETHVLTVLGSYRLGRGWEIGARYRLTSGYMYTPEQYGFYDESVGTYLALAAYPPNQSRLPLFHSLDIRIDKTWQFGWGRIGAYLDVINVYNQGNVDGISYDYNSTHSGYALDLPIVPSIGLRVDN